MRHLWQLDLVGGIYLAGGRERKMLTGIDDHSRYVVIAAVLAVPSGRAVCEAFAAAMARHGVPQEVFTDNGKQFTGRFTRPRPAEALFERVCRENGITARLTKPRSLNVLMARDPASHVILDSPVGIARLPRVLREAGADEAVTALAGRAANAGMFGLFLQSFPENASRYLFGREPDGTPSQS